MSKNYKRMSYDCFNRYIDEISERLKEYIDKNDLKIDYICPILRSGGIPAIYISNKLNIIKFAPMQVKHISYKNGENTIEIIFNPFYAIKVNKSDPVFLVVECMHSTGFSAKLCIDEIKRMYKNAKIMYVCLTKEYGSRDFSEETIYEDKCFYYNGNNDFGMEKCNELGIEYYYPLFPWENLDVELNHPDDLEENIFF